MVRLYSRTLNLPTLNIIISISYWFKIGKFNKRRTSLSKGRNLIQRFSEDIDIFLDLLAFEPPLTKRGIDRELKSLRDAVAAHPALQFAPEETFLAKRRIVRSLCATLVCRDRWGISKADKLWAAYYSQELMTNMLTHYLFLDEAYQAKDDQRRIVMSGWLVEEISFRSKFDSKRSLYRTPILDSINSALEEVDGTALVASANLQSNLARTGERDSTDDITSMSRGDNIWSQCLIFTVASLIRKMISRRCDVGAIDVFHDPKSLKLDHTDAIHRTLRGPVITLAKQFTSERKIELLKHLELRHISPVAKAHGNPPDAFQKAIWIADRLCSLALNGNLSKEARRIVSVDMTALIKKTVQQFDGIPFDEHA